MLLYILLILAFDIAALIGIPTVILLVLNLFWPLFGRKGFQDVTNIIVRVFFGKIDKTGAPTWKSLIIRLAIYSVFAVLLIGKYIMWPTELWMSHSTKCDGALFLNKQSDWGITEIVCKNGSDREFYFKDKQQEDLYVKQVFSKYKPNVSTDTYDFYIGDFTIKYDMGKFMGFTNYIKDLNFKPSNTTKIFPDWVIKCDQTYVSACKSGISRLDIGILVFLVLLAYIAILRVYDSKGWDRIGAIVLFAFWLTLFINKYGSLRIKLQKCENNLNSLQVVKCLNPYIYKFGPNRVGGNQTFIRCSLGKDKFVDYIVPISRAESYLYDFRDYLNTRKHIYLKLLNGAVVDFKE